MRPLIKSFIISTASLYLVASVVKGMEFSEGTYTLLLAGFVLMLATLVVKPVLTILLLPLNMITLGLFKWVTYLITFYLVTLVVPGFKLTGFNFPGYTSYWVNLPPIYLNGILAFVAFSFVVSFVYTILHWVFK